MQQGMCNGKVLGEYRIMNGGRVTTPRDKSGIDSVKDGDSYTYLADGDASLKQINRIRIG